MTQLILGIGDLDAAILPETTIKTFALGSCVAVILLDPATRCVGMVHIALADSAINPEKAQTLPGYFADTAIPALLMRMREVAGATTGGGMVAKLAGGAAIISSNDVFNIGRKNLETSRKVLAALGLRVVAEDTGSNVSRTVSAEVASGQVSIHIPGLPPRTL